jgi:hypothetical protein
MMYRACDCFHHPCKHNPGFKAKPPKLLSYKKLQQLRKKDALIDAVFKDRQSYVNETMDFFQRVFGKLKIVRKDDNKRTTR